MKCCLVCACGIADRPVKRLGKKTPLEMSNTPALDFLASNGQVGRVRMVPKDSFPRPDLANFSMFGYDPEEEYVGAGVVEAANAGITLRGNETVFVADLVTVNDEVMTSFPESRLTEREAKTLFEALNVNFGSERLEFIHLHSHRGVAVFRGDDFDLDTTVPMQAASDLYEKYLPRGLGEDMIIDIMRRSTKVLSLNEINVVRVDLGENPANMLWLWGPGRPGGLRSFQEKFNHGASLISRLHLSTGLARFLKIGVSEMEPREPNGGPNYLEKINRIRSGLKENDFVVLQLESSYRPSTQDNVPVKVKCIEELDRRIVAPLLSMAEKDPELQILVTSDFPVYCETGERKSDPVPFVLFGQGVSPGKAESFSEREAKRGVLIDPGYTLVSEILLNM